MIEYVVIDPVLGEVSFGAHNLARAREYSEGVKGEVFRVFWVDGEEVKRVQILPPTT